MYGTLRFKAGFHEKVDKFIEAAEKHATTLKENKDTIICPYKDCNNRMAWTDVTIIIEHLIM
jgi:lipid II:glycine glycyltransferase (peptidoglycan interpeptide bridge formation enzyme)